MRATVASAPRQYTRGSATRQPDGITDERGRDGCIIMAGQRAILRNLQLRLCVSLYHGTAGGPADQGVVHVRHGVPDRPRELRLGVPGRSGLHYSRVDAGGNGQGELVGRCHRRRAGECRAARRHYGHRERVRGRPHGGPCRLWSATFLGVESAPIRFDRAGVKWSVTAAKLVHMAAEPGHGGQPRHHGAARSGQHGPSGRESGCPRPCVEEPRGRPGD